MQRHKKFVYIKDRSHHCVYCEQLITIDDDSQQANKQEWAHARYAWGVNDASFATLDAAEGQSR